ncbi:hypothetical protein GCM10008918_11040 [Lactobacillus kefiranofaciens subsp. kefiranofaciens]
MKKFLKVLVSCLVIFYVIDSCLYIFFDFRCIDAVLKLLGIKNGLNGIPKWISIIVCIAVLILIVKYDAI